MSQNPITRYKDVAALLKKGWRVLDRSTLISTTGEKRDAWINAIEACRKRGLVPEEKRS